VIAFSLMMVLFCCWICLLNVFPGSIIISLTDYCLCFCFILY
jgi:hypothetical protein